MRKIAVFASGEGSNFEALVKACSEGRLKAEVALMVCDRPGAPVCRRALRLGIPSITISPKTFDCKSDYERYLGDRLEELGVSLICLAGYMRIIGPELLSRFERRILNIHPSLLPSFKGANALKEAFDYGVKVFGVTVHYVDETLDGGKIIDQASLKYEGSDFEELTRKIHEIEHSLYPCAVARMLEEEKGMT